MRHPEIIKTIQEILRRVAPDATAILFGSEARGDARPDSDIDVLILVDKEKISLQDRQTITFPLYDVELDTGIMISPKVFSKQVWEEQMSITPFYRNVMKEGILLWTKNYADFIYFDRETVDELYQQAALFIKIIEKLIKR